MNESAKHKAPVAFRLLPDDERALATIPGNRSEILRRGIHLQAQEHIPLHPLYPERVSDPRIQDALEEAVQLCVRRLDGLFGDEPAERGGISSNFQALLLDHVKAMLTGRPSAKLAYHRPLNALFGDDWTFGKPLTLETGEGVTLYQVPVHLDVEELFYDDSTKRFVPREELKFGELFTNCEAAIKAGFEWLRENEISPRDMPLRLCKFRINDADALELAELAMP